MRYARTLRARPDWIWLAAALLIIAFVTAVETRGSAAVERPLSVSNPNPSGALAAYLWLHRLGYRTERLPALDLRRLRSGQSTLFLLSEASSVSSPEAARLYAWMRSGGRVVAAALSQTQPVLATAGLRTVGQAVSAVQVVQPVLTRPPAVALGVGAHNIIRLGRGSIVAQTLHGAVLVRTQVGKGELWTLSIPQALENDRIAKAADPGLLLALAGGQPRTLAFVELPAPPVRETTTTTSWVTGLPWGIAGLFALATILAYRFVTGWRLGPPVRTLNEGGRPAPEYVVAMAGLLQKGRKRQEVLAMYRRQARGRAAPQDGEDDIPAPHNLTDRDLLDHCRRLAEITEYDSGSAAGSGPHWRHQ